jgi:heme exporter protein D
MRQLASKFDRGMKSLRDATSFASFVGLFVFLALQAIYGDKPAKNGKDAKLVGSESTLIWIIVGVVTLLIIVLIAYLNHKKRLREKAEWEARKARILEAYGEEIGNLILAKKIVEGMTEEMLFEAWGQPGKKEDSVLRGKAIILYFFGGSRNQRGNVKYAQRVTVENGLIIGWKDGNF